MSGRPEVNTDKYCAVKKLDFLDIPKNRAEFHYSRADTLLKEGKNTTLELERICIELTRACSLKPREVKNFLGLAECFRRACDSSSAIFSLRFALQLHPNSTFVKQQLGELLINRAQELMKLGKHYNKASKYFEEALGLDGSRDNIWLLRCICEIHCKEFETALQCINRTINLSTDDSIDSYVIRAKIHWAMGNMDIGNKDLRKAMVIDKDHPEVKAFVNRSFEDARRFYNQGIEHFKEGNIKEAISCCENALIINGEDIKLYLMLSKMHRHKGDLNEAFRYLKDAEKQYLKGDPYNAFPIQKLPFEISRQQNLVINEMAMEAAVEGDCEKAIILLNKAISSERRINEDPTQIPFIYFMNRGDCYRSQNQPLFAIADYKLALERSPDNWDVLTKLSMSHYLLAVDYFNDSKFLSCYEQIDGAIQLYNDKVPEYYALRGKSAYFQGLYHEAYLDFKIVLEKNPENVEILKYMRQFESPPDKEQDTTDDLFVGVSGKQKPEEERNRTCNVVDNMLRSQSTSSIIKKVKVKPSSISIINDPLGVNNDYERLAHWNTTSNGEEKDLNIPMSISKCTAMLPDVNPYLAASVVYHEAAKPRMTELNNTLHSRTNVEESNLWGLIREAETQGRRMRKPKNEKHVGLTESQILAKKSRKIPPSSTALKRRSQERSKAALNNPLINGIVSSHNDPLLIAERSKKKLKNKKHHGHHHNHHHHNNNTSAAAGSGSGDDGRRLSDASVNSTHTTGSQLSICTTTSSQKEAMEHLLSPTIASQHHHDADHDVREAQERPKGAKPFMLLKRERTLTNFMMGDTSDTEDL